MITNDKLFKIYNHFIKYFKNFSVIQDIFYCCTGWIYVRYRNRYNKEEISKWYFHPSGVIEMVYGIAQIPSLGISIMDKLMKIHQMRVFL